MKIINEQNTRLSDSINVPIRIVEGYNSTELMGGKQIIVVMGDKLHLYDDTSAKPVETKKSVTVRSFSGVKELSTERILLNKKGITWYKRIQINKAVKSALILLGATPLTRRGLAKSKSWLI